jgi:methylmalonyl-CoA mutase, N-terminal domain
MQSQISEASYRYQREIESKDRIIVGLNEYQSEESAGSRSITRFSMNAEVEQRQQQRLTAWRANRDAARVAELHTQLERVARGNDNVMPCLVACVEGGMTVGEIGKVLRGVFGEYEAPTVI